MVAAHGDANHYILRKHVSSYLLTHLVTLVNKYMRRRIDSLHS